MDISIVIFATYYYEGIIDLLKWKNSIKSQIGYDFR
jgi:hypothetical protein